MGRTKSSKTPSNPCQSLEESLNLTRSSEEALTPLGYHSNPRQLSLIQSLREAPNPQGHRQILDDPLKYH